MPPELFYQIYQFFSVKDYDALRNIEWEYKLLGNKVNCFRDIFEAKIIYQSNRSLEYLVHHYWDGMTFILRNNPKWKGNYLVRWGSIYGNHEIVARRLEDKSLRTWNINNLLVLVAKNRAYCGTKKVIKLLLADPRCNPAWRNNRPLREAAENGNQVLVSMLLKDPRVDPTALDNYALRKASEEHHTIIVHLLRNNPRVKKSLS